jgi:hypothetical protein
MTHLYVDPICSDKEDETLYRSKKVSVDGKSIITPIMAYDVSLIRGSEQIAPATKGLNEIYQKMGTEKVPIRTLMSSMKAEKDFDNRLQTKYNKTDLVHEINMCVLEGDALTYPSGTELDFVLDTTQLISDIIPLPNFPTATIRIDSDSMFSDYTTFLADSIAYLKSSKEKKPIMGVVPKLSWEHTGKLVEFYINKGLNAFYVDFAARNSITAKRDFLHVFRVLSNHDMLDSSFVYAYNVDAGRLAKTADIVNAKDVLSYGFGFDAMGRKHRRVKATAEVWRKINILPNRIRMFNKNDYGYYKILNIEKIKGIYPLDSCLSMDKFAKHFSLNVSELRRCENVFNSEQLGLEALRLRRIIKSDKPTDYLLSKTYVKEKYIKTMKSFKKAITSESSRDSLEHWFG